MWSAARSAKISMILCMPERVSGGDAKFQGFCDRWNKWEGQVSALIAQAKKLPTELYKSLTWDRGKELADHRRFSLATDIDVYFCDPQSPWQRGSNENTNGLLRQYFPKGTDVSVYSQAHLNKVARQLNERPRKTLEFETPAERFNACVASTG